MSAVVGERGVGIVGAGGADSVVRHLDFGIFLAPEAVEAAHYLAGIFNARTDGEFEIHADARVILGGHELGSDAAHQEYGANEDCKTDDNGFPAIANDLYEQAGIGGVELVESAGNGAVPGLLEAAFGSRVTQAEPLAAEHRSESQGTGG